VNAGTVGLSTDTVDGNQAFGGQATANGVNRTTDGGGIDVAGGTVNLSSDTVDSNTTFNTTTSGYSGYGYGGGLYVAAGTVSLSNCTVEFNMANAGAGGIDIGSGTATLCNDTVESNYGAGIEIYSGATVYIDSYTVAHTINNNNPNGGQIFGPYILQNC
jgi:hypothetical protein